jgi:hypothetical protein
LRAPVLLFRHPKEWLALLGGFAVRNRFRTDGKPELYVGTHAKSARRLIVIIFALAIMGFGI